MEKRRKYNTDDGEFVKIEYRLNRLKKITPVIKGYSFTLNRSNDNSGARYFKCVAAGCETRLTIYSSNNEEGIMPETF